MDTKPPHEELTCQREKHAAAYRTRNLPPCMDLTLSEALVLGLLRQGVKTYLTVFGHGSTEVGEVLRVYQEAGLVKVYGVRSEIEASHAASALRWVTGEKAAVVTSIGPGALQALAASLVEDQPLLEAVRFANAAAAICVTRLGAQPSIPLRQETERFLCERS